MLWALGWEWSFGLVICALRCAEAAAAAVAMPMWLLLLPHLLDVLLAIVDSGHLCCWQQHATSMRHQCQWFVQCWKGLCLSCGLLTVWVQKRSVPQWHHSCRQLEEYTQHWCDVHHTGQWPCAQGWTHLHPWHEHAANDSCCKLVTTFSVYIAVSCCWHAWYMPLDQPPTCFLHCHMPPIHIHHLYSCKAAKMWCCHSTTSLFHHHWCFPWPIWHWPEPPYFSDCLQSTDSAFDTTNLKRSSRISLVNVGCDMSLQAVIHQFFHVLVISVQWFFKQGRTVPWRKVAPNKYMLLIYFISDTRLYSTNHSLEIWHHILVQKFVHTRTQHIVISHTHIQTFHAHRDGHSRTATHSARVSELVVIWNERQMTVEFLLW